MRILFLLVSLLLLSSPAITPAAYARTSPTVLAAADRKSQTVYITRTGHKYHRAGCRYLSRSMIPIPLADARGSYGACKVCNPPR